MRQHHDSLMISHIAIMVGVCLLALSSRADEDVYDLLYKDDSASTTLNFVSNDGIDQIHNFWLEGDEDWALFNADPGRAYDINVESQEASCDAEISLFQYDNLTTPIVTIDDWHPPLNADELLSWFSGTTAGTMAVRVRISPASPTLFGNDTGYRLRIFGAWGPSAGLATITGTGHNINSSGYDLWAGSVVIDGFPVYTKVAQLVPPGALSADIFFALDDPGDVGPYPFFEWTRSWLNQHPTNACLVHIISAIPVTFSTDATLILQFRDDVGTYDGFTIDDLPPGTQASDMSIHAWNESTHTWDIVPGEQTVVDDTVTMPISSLGSGLFAVAPVSAPSSVENWVLWR